jgi:hypothetical protein
LGTGKQDRYFDRYNILEEKDLAEAAALLDAKAQQRELRHRVN